MAAFSRTPGKNLVDLVNLDMNEDQGMTTFIMRVRMSACSFHVNWPGGTSGVSGDKPLPRSAVGACLFFLPDWRSLVTLLRHRKRGRLKTRCTRFIRQCLVPANA